MRRMLPSAVAVVVLALVWTLGMPVARRLMAESAGARATQITHGHPFPATTFDGTPAPAAAVPFPHGVTPEAVGTLEGHIAPVAGIAFAPDGKWLISMGGNLTPKYWLVETRVEYLLPGTGDIMLADVTYDPLGRTVGAVDNGGLLTLWDLAGGIPGEPRSVPAGGYTPRLAVSPNGGLLAVASWDKTVRIWEAGARRLAAELKSETPLRSLAFSPDGRTLALGDSGNRLILWDLATGARRAHRVPRVAPTADLAALAFSPDGRSLAIGCMDSSIVVWDVRAGRDRLNYFVRGASTWDVAIAPAGDVIVTASQDGHVRLWSLATGALQCDMPAHQGAVRAVAFSPDGRWLASGGDDGKIRLWR